MRLLAIAGCVAALGGCAHGELMSQRASPEMQAAVDEAQKSRVNGPRDIKLAERTFLALAEGLVYIPAAQADRLLRAMGERPGLEVLGVVVTDAPDPLLIAVIYAKGRSARGVTEVEVVGWDHAPEMMPFRSK